jgi:hypothetical protein
MPHRTCSVCVHEQRAAIDLALRKGSPTLRALATVMALAKRPCFVTSNISTGSYHAQTLRKSMPWIMKFGAFKGLYGRHSEVGPGLL